MDMSELTASLELMLGHLARATSEAERAVIATGKLYESPEAAITLEPVEIDGTAWDKRFGELLYQDFVAGGRVRRYLLPDAARMPIQVLRALYDASIAEPDVAAGYARSRAEVDWLRRVIVESPGRTYIHRVKRPATSPYYSVRVRGRASHGASYAQMLVLMELPGQAELARFYEG